MLLSLALSTALPLVWAQEGNCIEEFLRSGPLRECETGPFRWTGCYPPFSLTVADVTTGRAGTRRLIASGLTGETYSWHVDYPAGTMLEFVLTSLSEPNPPSTRITVGEGNTACDLYGDYEARRSSASAPRSTDISTAPRRVAPSTPAPGRRSTITSTSATRVAPVNATRVRVAPETTIRTRTDTIRTRTDVTTYTTTTSEPIGYTSPPPDDQPFTPTLLDDPPPPTTIGDTVWVHVTRTGDRETTTVIMTETAVAETEPPVVETEPPVETEAPVEVQSSSTWSPDSPISTDEWVPSSSAASTPARPRLPGSATSAGNAAESSTTTVLVAGPEASVEGGADRAAEGEDSSVNLGAIIGGAVGGGVGLGLVLMGALLFGWLKRRQTHMPVDVEPDLPEPERVVITPYKGGLEGAYHDPFNSQALYDPYEPAAKAATSASSESALPAGAQPSALTARDFATDAGAMRERLPPQYDPTWNPGP